MQDDQYGKIAIFWLLNSFAVIVNTSTHRKVLQTKVDTLHELSQHLDQGCSDKYMTLPLDLISGVHEPLELE